MMDPAHRWTSSHCCRRALRALTAAPFIYQFPALIDEWHDGDTCYVHRGASPGVIIHGEHVRVEGINAPELRAAGGIASRDYAISIAPPGTVVTLMCAREDKYGRLLGRVILPNGDDFSAKMIEAGRAAPYMV
jgi:endonuclease YncB( thermonuclease family)